MFYKCSSLKVYETDNPDADWIIPNGDNTNVRVDYMISGTDSGTLTVQQNKKYMADGKYPITSESKHGTVTGLATSAYSGTKIEFTVTPNDGYFVSTVTYNDGEDHDTTFANGKYSFTMPVNKAVKVTVNYTTGCYLDLDETSDIYLKSKNIDQNYTLTQTGETTYTDVSKVKVEWTVTDIAATYTSAKTWDPDKMEWAESKDISGLDDDHTATFKLTNFSSTKVGAAVTFAAEDALKSTLTSASFKNGETDVTGKSVILDTAVKADRSIDSTKTGANTPNATVTATLTFNEDEFAKLSEQKTAAKYGTYTVTLKNVYTVTVSYVANVDDTVMAKETLYVIEGTSIERGKIGEFNKIKIGESTFITAEPLTTGIDNDGKLSFSYWSLPGSPLNPATKVTDNMDIKAIYEKNQAR